jgi:signal transduction histidine kinase
MSLLGAWMSFSAKKFGKLSVKLRILFGGLIATLVAITYLGAHGLHAASGSLNKVGDSAVNRIISLRRLDHELLRYRMMHYQALSKVTRTEAVEALGQFERARNSIDAHIAVYKKQELSDNERKALVQLTDIWEQYKKRDVELSRLIKAWNRIETDKMVKKRFVPIAVKLAPACERLVQMCENDTKAEAEVASQSASVWARVSILISLIGILAGSLAAYTLHAILKRLAKLSKQMAVISSTKEDMRRVDEGQDDELGDLARITNSMLDTKEQFMEELNLVHGKLQRLISSLPFALVVFDQGGQVLARNDVAKRLFPTQLGAEDHGCVWDLPIGWDLEYIKDSLSESTRSKLPIFLVSAKTEREEGTGYYDIFLTPVDYNLNLSSEYLLVAIDATDRQLLHCQINQSQKLESIGQLAAGIAHEINTPVQYVTDNIVFLKDACVVLLQVIGLQESLLNRLVKSEDVCKAMDDLKKEQDKRDLDYLVDQVPVAIDDCLEGLARVTSIVRAMKEFSHPDGEGMVPVNLNQAIETTVNVSRNVWKYHTKMDLQLQRDLPMVTCNGGQINQVILNMIVNAAHAIEDAVKDSGQMGTMTITTRTVEDDRVEIKICDTGCGIPESVRDKVFDPFFTTKEVGKGTGQGLSMSHNVIVGLHKGQIDFTSEVGSGTTFRITLPIVQAARTSTRDAA